MTDDEWSDLEKLDSQLLALLEARAKLLAAAEDPEPLSEALIRADRVLQGSESRTFPAESAREILRQVAQACISLRAPLEIAYLGPAGTFTHMAARREFGPSHHYSPAGTISTVFESVERGQAQRGVVPIENSTEGGVAQTLDCLLTAGQTLIVAELELTVVQCLVGLQPDLTQIERVYSHPQGLAQCRAWLSQNLPHAEQRASSSTSAAAQEAARDTRAAAVASELAAELSGVAVVRPSIQDHVHNVTRFLVLGREPAKPSGRDKTSIVFTAPHQRGALKRILDIFDADNLNLTRIESRPGHERLWEYVFFVDLEGHRAEPGLARALRALEQHCAMVKVLGSYPRAS